MWFQTQKLSYIIQGSSFFGIKYLIHILYSVFLYWHRALGLGCNNIDMWMLNVLFTLSVHIIVYCIIWCKKAGKCSESHCYTVLYETVTESDEQIKMKSKSKEEYISTNKNIILMGLRAVSLVLFKHTIRYSVGMDEYSFAHIIIVINIIISKIFCWGRWWIVLLFFFSSSSSFSTISNGMTSFSYILFTSHSVVWWTLCDLSFT